jgi:ribonuclease P protein component
VYDQGSRVTSSSFALFFARRSTGPSGARIGFTTPRALGKSVIRNRIKRRMREAVRLELPRLSGSSIDYVIHPRRGVLTVAFPQLRREVERIFRKCESAS